MRVMVLGGVGAVASETTKDLLYNSIFNELVIADKDLVKAEHLVQELKQNCLKKYIPPDYRCEANRPDFYQKNISAVYINTSEVEQLVSFFRDMDVIACGLPHEYDLLVTEAAVKAGVNALDLSFADEQMHFDKQAKAKGITYIPGVGATPGITNVMARRGIELMDIAETIDIYFAAFRCLAPSPGLIETTFWEFDPAVKNRVYYQDNEFISVPP